MSQHALSADTESVLLLCGRFGGERQDPFQPLSSREYGEMAKWLNSLGLRPADLLAPTAQEYLASIHDVKLDGKRIAFLLSRGTALALALERWSRGGLWVISRGDPEFPKLLKRRLKHAAPPLLYGAGEKSLLDEGGLAIVGSRNATEKALEITRAIASKCAGESIAVVSGGARGVDSAAMQGATEAGGICIGVLANDLLKTSVNRQNRIGLQEGRLVLVSPFYPEAGFNAGNAMARNKYIYTLSNQALVIDSALGSGGTWEGAVENLNQKWVPLYVHESANSPGNEALISKGGNAFSFPLNTAETLTELFERDVAEGRIDSSLDNSQASLLTIDALVDEPLRASEGNQHISHESSETVSVSLVGTELPVGLDTKELVDEDNSVEQRLDMYDDFVSKLTLILSRKALTEEEVAVALSLEKGQTKVWLKRTVESGRVEKLKKPIRYALTQQTPFLC